MQKPDHTLEVAATREGQSDSSRTFDLIERLATDPHSDPAKLREILAVKQSWEADEARKAFARDMARFQSQCPIITKGDDAYGKKYARIDRIHRETRELRKQCGFWFTWSKCEVTDNVAHMEGLLGHSGGHTVPIKQIIPLPDTLKGQNATQRAGSAMTYAKRYGECLALDIVTGEDDDGNAGRPKPAGPGVRPSDDELKRKLADLTRDIHGVPAGTKMSDADKDVAESYLREQGLILDTETLAGLAGARLSEVVKKLEAA